MSAMAPRSCKAIERLVENMKDTNRLLEIHKDISGDKRGRRWGMAVLNNSGVVLVTAFWEAFVEDLAEESFGFLLSNARSPSRIPAKVRALSARALREHSDETKVWDLAQNGWRRVLRDHEAQLLTRHIGSFNTPKPDNIDALFEGLIGLRHLSSCWNWRGQSITQARDNLTKRIEDRGAIAHRGRTNEPIEKDYVRRYRDFVYRLAVKATNQVARHLQVVTGKRPWSSYRFGAVS